MWGNAQATTTLNKFQGVVAFIGTYGSSGTCSLFCQHRGTRIPLFTCASFSDFSLYDQSVSIFRQDVPHVTQL